MSDQGASAFPSQTTVECGICAGSVNVSWFCKYCGGSLCDTCKQAHKKTPLFRSHLVVPRTIEVLRLHGPAKIAELCPFHTTKDISSYCDDCKVPCCVLCESEKHQRHAFTPIEDNYLFAEKNVNQYAKNLETNVKPMLVATMEKFIKNLKEKEARIDKVKDEINTFRQKLKHIVDKSCDLLLQELHESNSDLRNIIEKLSSANQMVDKLISEVHLRIREGKLSLIEYSPPEPASLVPDVTLPIQNIPNFVPERDLIDIIHNKVGRIEYLEQKVGDKTDRKGFQTLPVQDVPKKKSVPPAKRFDRADITIADVRTIRTKIMARSITAAASKSAWIMEYDVDTVYLINSMNVTIKSVTVLGSRGIRDMAMTKSGEIIATCTDKKVRRLSVSNEVSILLDTELFYPDGVCLTDKEEIVLCMSGQDDRNHVVVYSPDGRRKIREIRGVDGQGKHLIRKPYRVVTNGKDLCVLNVNNVVCVDDMDFMKWVYDGRMARQSFSFYPRGICVDKYHNMLVTDNNNHCVHFINREGKLIQVLLTQVQIKVNPCGICVDDETGKVWVGNTLGNVVVANYLK